MSNTRSKKATVGVVNIATGQTTQMTYGQAKEVVRNKNTNSTDHALDAGLSKAIDSISRTIAKNRNYVGFHYGKVISVGVGTGTATVTISGGTNQITDVRYLADVTPVAGNVCVLLSIEQDLLIIGTLT